MVELDASMHLMSKSDLVHEENNWEFEEDLYDYASEWNHHDDTRSHCLRQRFGHVDYSSIIERFTSCTLARTMMRRT